MGIENSVEPQIKNQAKKRLKQLGIAGFVFFLVKGLIWVGVAVWAIIRLK